MTRTSSSDRSNEQEVNQSWNKIVSAADMVNGEYIDLVSFMDDIHEEVQNSSAELDNGSQVSIGQLSTVASSGYQSFGYSQSSSPVDSSTQQDLIIPTAQPLSFSNPLFNHQNHTQTAAPPSGITRVLSSSSLSSDDGGSCTTSPCHTTSSQHHHSHINNHHSQPHSQPRHEHTQRKPSNLSCSSSSSESLKDKCQSPTNSHAHRSRNGRGPQLVHSHSVSGNTNLGSPIESRPLTISELSKSAEFAQLKRQPLSPQGMKRTVTDGTLSQSANNSAHAHDCYSTRRSTMPQNTVCMGVRSVQRRIQDQESNKAEVYARLEFSLVTCTVSSHEKKKHVKIMIQEFHNQ